MSDTYTEGKFRQLIPSDHDVSNAACALRGVVDGKPYFAPFDWGQTSITYRTDLVDWQDQDEF